MLDILRKSAAGWVAKIFIALLVLSFAVWGIADIFTGFGTRTLLKVGNAEVSPEDFQIAFNRRMQTLGQRFGRPLTLQEARALGLQNQVLGTLAAEATLNDRAHAFKLGVSDKFLAEEIANEPIFHGINGQFERNRFEQVLRSINVREDAYIKSVNDQILRSQIARALVGGMPVPTAMLELANQYQNEQRKIAYLILPLSNIQAIPDPDEAILSKYYEKNKNQFSAPEYRTVDLIKLEPTDIAKASDISNDAAREEYENRRDEYTIAEKRKVRQILFTSKEEAEAAMRKIQSGVSFDDIAAEQGNNSNITELGLQAKTDFVDANVAAAAFALQKNNISDIIESRFGPLIVSVSDIQEKQIRPFEEVINSVKETMAKERAEDDIFDLHDNIVDARAGGATLGEIAKRYNLSLQHIEAINQSGIAPDGTAINIPDKVSLLRAIFQAEEGEENDPLQLGSTGFIWYDVTAIAPAHERPLDDVRQDVITAWKNAESNKKLDQQAHDILKQINAGQSLSEFAKEHKLTYAISDFFTRSQPAESIGTSATQAAFGGPVGYRATTTDTDGKNRLVFEVIDVTVPAFFDEAENIRQIKDNLSTTLQDDLLRNYIDRVQQELGIHINQPLVDQLTNGSSRL